MADGKRGTAPCGHEGVAVVGQYYQCLRGCDRVAKSDGVPLEIEPEITKAICRLCQSCNTLRWPDFVDYWFCIDCHRSFYA